MVARTRSHNYLFGPYRLDSNRRVLFRDGRIVPLTPKAFGVLQILVSRAGEAVSKEEIIREAWSQSVGSEANLSVNVAAIRKALGDDPRAHRYIVTLPAQGYVFVEPVTIAEDEPSEAAEPAVESETMRVAVLPFRSLDSAVDSDLFGFGLADALITELARLERVALVGSETVRPYAGDGVDPLAAGRELRADLVIVGVVRRGTAGIMVTVQVLQASDGVVLWAEDYHEEPDRPFSVQYHIASDLCRRFDLRGGCAESLDRFLAYTEEPTAHRLFVRARYLASIGDPDSMREAGDLLRQALVLDDRFVAAYEQLAQSTFVLWLAGQVGSREAVSTIETAARHALAAEPRSAGAHLSLGNVAFAYRWDWETARRHFLAAIELRPTWASPYAEYSLQLTCEGRFEEALQGLRRAMMLDPLSPYLASRLVMALYCRGENEEALHETLSILDRFPEFYWARLLHAMILLTIGMPEESVESLRPFVERAGTPARMLAYHAGALHQCGRREEAEEIVRRMESSEVGDAAPGTTMATAYTLVGRQSEAVVCLAKALNNRESTMPFITVHPIWKPLRGHAGFREILQRVVERGGPRKLI